MINLSIKRAFSTTLSAILAIMLILPQGIYAQNVANLPTPGTLITTSPSYTPAIMAGMTIYPDNPLKFDFIIDVGDDNLNGDALKNESEKLISYFMASLTVPEDEMWVNLSPYEKDRIIANGLGDTILGRDMLAQDYMLKQLTASMVYPENELGRKFWERVYAKAQAKLGTKEVPADTFNKIWIVPEEAVIYVNDTNIFVADSHLKVMLEEDYLALEYHDKGLDTKANPASLAKETKEILREIILPEIEREVNEGKNFAALRQIYHSLILATWYKKNLKESLLGKIYVDQNKTNGVDVSDKNIKLKIYNQYVEAFKKGVFDYIREDYDGETKQLIPRKYFSGGEDFERLSEEAMRDADAVKPDAWLHKRRGSRKVRAQARADLSSGNADILSNPSVEELESKLYAVHATPVLPQGEFLVAGAADSSTEWREHENLAPHFRPTIHFALGEMIKGNDRDKNYPYAVVTPMGNIINQTVNVFPTDTFVLGNVRLSNNTILVVPEGTNTENVPDNVPIVQYSSDKTLRDAVNDVIKEQGGWHVSLPDEFHPGLPATIGDVDINSVDFFGPIFEKYPHLAFGTHVGSEVGMAGLFGSLDFSTSTLTRPYLLQSPAVDKESTEIIYEMVKTNLRRLDKLIAEHNFPEEALQGYQVKRNELLEWLNIVEVDLEIRRSTGRMVANPKRKISDIIRAHRADKDALMRLMLENRDELRSIFEARRPDSLPAYIATYFEVYSTEELEGIKEQNQKLAQVIDKPQFRFRYAIERWLSVKSERARAEGLDSMLGNSITALSAESDFDSLAVISALIIEGGGMAIGNNRLETALDILRLPAVKNYLRDKYQIDFGEQGPNSLEDVLRAHPDTNEFYSDFKKPTIENEDLFREFLEKIGFLYPLKDVQEAQSFEQVEAFVSRREGYWRNFKKNADVMRTKKLSETVDPDEIVGRMPSFYEAFRASDEPAEKFENLGLREQYEEMFGPGEKGKAAFWRSDKTLFQVFLDLRKAAGIVDGGANDLMLGKTEADPAKPGGIDFNANNLKINVRGQEIQFTVPENLQGIQPDSVNGITPVIINITPITNFLPLLGISDKKESDNQQLSRLP